MKTRRWQHLVAGLLLPLTAFGAKDDTWLRLSTPEFSVVTPLTEKQAKAWAAEFAQYVAALQSLFHTGGRKFTPLTVVLFARDRDFQRYRPLGQNGKAQEVGGFFFRLESWSVAGLAGAEQSADVRRTIFHEGVHWFLSATERPNPVWLEEGTAEVFSTFNVTRNTMEWGRAVDNHVALLNATRPIPLAQLFSTARSDLFGDDSLRTGIVYAEAWAFVHFLLFGKHNLPPGALGHFVTALQTGSLQDVAFRDAFGRNYEGMDELLDGYLRSGQYYVRRMPVVNVPPPVVQPATTLEVEDALGRLDFAARRFDDAAVHARAAIAAAPDDARGHEVLAVVLREQQQPEAARAEFALAIEKGTHDFLPFFEVGRAAHDAAIGDGGGSIAPAGARAVANNYERAINLRPRFLPAYQNLASVIGVAEPWGKDDRDFLELGAKLFPDDALIRIGLAVLTHRGGDVPAAQKQLTEILARDDLKTSVRNFGRRLEDGWESQIVLTELQQLTEPRKSTRLWRWWNDSWRDRSPHRCACNWSRSKSSC